jgi:hypothetical protein
MLTPAKYTNVSTIPSPKAAAAITQNVNIGDLKHNQQRTSDTTADGSAYRSADLRLSSSIEIPSISDPAR